MTKNGTNTGTGGFNLDDKANSYDVVPEGEPGLGPVPQRPPYDKGDIDVATTKRDISTFTRVRLGQYLSDQTTKNYIPISRDTADVSSIRDNNGKTPALKTSDNSYAPLLSTTPLVDGLNKGNPTTKDDNGNKFLEKEANTRTHINSITANSRFARANNRYALGEKTGDTVKDVYVLDYERQIVNDLEAAIGTDSHSIVQENYMENIGVLMSLRGTGEILARGGDIDPSSNKQQLGAFIPSFAQTATVKIDNAQLDPKNIIKDVSRDSGVTRTSKISINEYSWGVLNNVHEPYSGITVIGMRALVLGLKTGFTALVTSIGTIGETSQERIGRTSGFAFDHQEAGFVRSFLQLPRTINPLPKCVSIGLQLFMGEQPTTNPLDATLNAITGEFQTIDNADLGRKAVVLRNILRTAAVITEKIRDLLNKANITATIQDSFELINTIRNSKLFSAIRIFGLAGDSWLERSISADAATPEAAARNSALAKYVAGAGGNSPSPLSETAQNRANYIPKSGVTTTEAFNRRVPWANSTSPSMYLIPKNLKAFASSMGAAFMHSAPNNKLNEIKDEIKPDAVQEFEKKLESEYVPFYFHDLRTNEIVSFHAFLGTLSESYTVNYSSDEGFGRIDPVKTYKNTGRRIELSFTVVATNDADVGSGDTKNIDDFSTFWYKINKLTTLLYPQYTLGKRVQDTFNSPTYRLVQPFSQLIGASPMIRLRIGDLITTNYSKFALMRLFGFGEVNGTTEDGNILNGITVEYKQTQAAKQPDYNQKVGKDVEIPIAIAEKIDDRIRQLPADKKAGISKLIGTFTQGATVGSAGVKLTFSSLKKTEAILDAAGKLNLQNIITKLGGEEMSINLDKTDQRIQEIVGAIVLTEAEKATIRAQIEQENAPNARAAAAIDAVGKFFSSNDAENNAIVRSFNKTGGQGLAGFIESMSFDWHTNVTWEVDKNKGRAPKMCKITMSFAPIHDISPGLSSTGANRAPIYPVGEHFKSYNRKNDTSTGGNTGGTPPATGGA